MGNFDGIMGTIMKENLHKGSCMEKGYINEVMGEFMTESE